MRLALLVLIGACGGGPSVPADSPSPFPDGGPGPDGNARLSFSWELQIGGSLAECFEVNAKEVEIRSFNRASGASTGKRFPCMPTGVGATDPLTAGGYAIQLSLFDDLGNAIQTLPSEDLTLNAGDDVSLGLRVFSP